MVWEAIIGNPFIVSGFVGVARSILGWVENAFKDGKITGWEWKQLGATILRCGTQDFILGLLGFPAGIGILTDYAYVKADKIAKNGKKK